MHMAGSLLPSEGHDTLDPVPFKSGILQVVRLLERETYAVTYRLTGWEAAPAFIAAHPNGYSCKELVNRITKDEDRATAQFVYILQCGGYGVTKAYFADTLMGRLVPSREADLFTDDRHAAAAAAEWL